jgi:hypothetical protein
MTGRLTVRSSAAHWLPRFERTGTGHQRDDWDATCSPHMDDQMKLRSTSRAGIRCRSRPGAGVSDRDTCVGPAGPFGTLTRAPQHAEYGPRGRSREDRSTCHVICLHGQTMSDRTREICSQSFVRVGSILLEPLMIRTVRQSGMCTRL